MLPEGSDGSRLSPQSVTLEHIEQLTEAVLRKRPTLREIIEKRGGKTLYEYAREYSDVNINPSIHDRQNECIETVRTQVASRLGTDIASGVSKQLKKYYFVSTADHHGPMCHSFFLNSNLVTSITCLEQQDADLNYVVVFSCANVSFANHTYPRGILFNSYSKGKIQTQQLGFFPNSSEVRQSRVFGYRPYTVDDIAKARRRLYELVLNGTVAREVSERIVMLLDDIYLQPDILASRNYSDQITKTNFRLWDMMFHVINIKGPRLLYIELEAVVNGLLLDHHLTKNTTLHRILFDPVYSGSFIKHFNNIEGGFSLEKNWGTYLFWALPSGAKYPKKLRKNGSFLVSDDGMFKIELTPESIRTAITLKELFPSTQLSLLVLSLYYGIKCLGGFCQVNYLTDMKAAYITMLEEVKELMSAEACVRVQTKELGEDLTIAFMNGPRGESALATTIDLILYGTDSTWRTLVAETKEMTLREALAPMMPDFYSVMYKEVDRDPILSTIRATNVMKAAGFERKVRACISIA